MIDYCEINYDNNMKNLSAAFKYCTENFLHDDIINELYNNNDLKKQLCLIELLSIKNQEEANILVSNLINHGGPIRETASFKILELIQNVEFGHYFQTNTILDIFIKAIIDINPAVSRNTVEIIKYVDNTQYIYEKLIDEINKTLLEIGDTKQNRSYISNKKNFSLYWNLEAIANLNKKIFFSEKLIQILEKTSKFKDYTIREKSAKLAKMFNIESILNLLKDDENIYVHNYL